MNAKLDFYDVADLQAIFGCGITKAQLMMQTLPSIRVGKKSMISRAALEQYLDEHDTIVIRWPRRNR